MNRRSAVRTRSAGHGINTSIEEEQQDTEFGHVTRLENFPLDDCQDFITPPLMWNGEPNKN